MQRLAVFLASLWWGGISALSFLAVPTLFAQLGAPVAGPVAAQLFSWQSWAGLVIGLALLLLLRRERAGGQWPPADPPVESERLAQMQRVLGTMGFVLAAMLLALTEFEKEALLVLAHGLAACGDHHSILTFTSRRRSWVRVETVKAFGEPMSTTVERRIGALRPGYYTRIGAAVRHAAALHASGLAP